MCFDMENQIEHHAGTFLLKTPCGAVERNLKKTQLKRRNNHENKNLSQKAIINQKNGC